MKNGLNRRDYIYGGVWTSNETKENYVDPKDLYEGKNSIFIFDLWFFSLFFPDITSEFTKLNESSLVTGLVVGTANDWISTKPSQNFTLWSELFSITEVKGKGTNNV